MQNKMASSWFVCTCSGKTETCSEGAERACELAVISIDDLNDLEKNLVRQLCIQQDESWREDESFREDVNPFLVVNFFKSQLPMQVNPAEGNPFFFPLKKLP